MGIQGEIFRAVSRAAPALGRQLGRPSAVFFHGVEPRLEDAALQSNHHALEAFAAIARSLKADFDVAPISDLAHVLKRPERYPRTVFLMADDGYANNLGVAAEVLGEFGLPWTLFVSTEHIDTGARNPMFLARLFLRFAPPGCYEIANLRQFVEIAPQSDRVSLAKQVIHELRALPAEQAKEAIASMNEAMAKAGLANLVDRYPSDAFLDWDGVRALAKRGVTIGAHAHWHWPMHEGETEESLQRQAHLPRQRIEAEVGPCRHFAYPFGNRGDVCSRAWRAVRDAGYDYAFTTLSAALDGRQNPWLLPRYGLAPREPNLAGRLPLLRLGNARHARWQRALAR
jgi:peptidoglycan/xylan/chitin deacetylase (PgdA/CDA1 family)